MPNILLQLTKDKIIQNVPRTILWTVCKVS